MINKFRYKKPAKESSGDNKGDGGDTLKTNKINKAKVFDNLDAIRISDGNNKSDDSKEVCRETVLDEKMKKQLHVRLIYKNSHMAS